jgi:hypothetical protein
LPFLKPFSSAPTLFKQYGERIYSQYLAAGQAETGARVLSATASATWWLIPWRRIT